MSRPVLVLTLGLLGLFGLSGPAWAEGAPYRDLNSRGGLYLCDKEGHALGSGSIDTKPFAWSAVSRQQPPAGFGGPGSSATLYAYQPRKEAYPDRWNGDQLTAATGYPAGTSPTAVGTPLDFSLRDFLSEFPARWDGSVQLRMYFGAKAHGYDGADYVSADLKVEGNRWRLLTDPTGSCTKASALKAASAEITVAHLDPSASTRPVPRPSSSHGPDQPPADGGAGSTSQAPARADAAKAASAATWSTVFGYAAAGIAGVGALATVGTWLRRRRAR